MNYNEKKLISVLFADIVDYTLIAEKLDPETIQQIMNGCFTVLNQQIQKYQGTLDKYLGDGILVLFGAPLAQEDHAQRACYAALDIQKSLREYSLKTQKEYAIDLKLRVGINSGIVLAGKIGIDLKSDYTAIGASVNLASYIQKTAAPGAIVCAQSTYALVKDYFEFEPLGDKPVKGKNGPVPVFRLIRSKKINRRFDAAVEKGLSRFWGRENELSLLTRTFSSLQDGGGRIVGVQGEPGVGKSRLLLEFVKSLTSEQFLYLEGRCQQYNNIPYQPLIGVIRQFFGINPRQSETQIKEQISQQVSLMDLDWLGALPFLYEILSLKIDERFQLMENQYRRMKLFETVSSLLIYKSRFQPVVLAIEDLQWLDRASEDFLDYFVTKNTKDPVLLLLTYRTEYLPPWTRLNYFQSIHLDNLAANTSRELLDSLLPDGEIDESTRRLILQKSGGNPLFVEEYVEKLLDNRRIISKAHYLGGALSAADLPIPDSIIGIIASRVDHLPHTLKKTLQVAAVIGREFSAPVLRTVLELLNGLESDLETLSQMEYIDHNNQSAEGEYIFKHSLIQEVAYNSLPLDRKAELHQSIGEAIEKLWPWRLEEFSEVLSYHFKLGKSKEKALLYLIRSGKKNLERYAIQAAHQYFQEAYRILVDFPDLKASEKNTLIDLLVEWAYVFYYLADFKGFMVLVNRHLEMVESFADNRRKALFLSWQGYILTCQAKPLESYAILHRARALVDGEAPTDQSGQSNQRLVNCFIYASICRACSEIGLFQEGREYSIRALNIINQGEYNTHLYVFAFTAAANIELHIGYYRQVRKYADTLITFGEKQGNISALVTGYTLYALIYAQWSNIELAHEYSQRALKLNPDPANWAVIQQSLAFSYLMGGRIQDFEPELKKTIAFCQKAEFYEIGNIVCGCWGLALLSAGHLEKGYKVIDQVKNALLQNGMIAGYGLIEMFWGSILAQIHFKKIKVKPAMAAKNLKFYLQNIPLSGSNAIRHYQTAAEVMANLGCYSALCAIYLGLGRLYLYDGKTKIALDYLEDCLYLSKEIEAEEYLKQAASLIEGAPINPGRNSK
jgi:predicted ATPase/class 3 adenylate cyclase